MKLVKHGADFVLDCSFHERHVAKDAGFRAKYEGQRFLYWYTTDPRTASKLMAYATDPDLVAELEGVRERAEETFALSRAIDLPDMEVPAPAGLE